MANNINVDVKSGQMKEMEKAAAENRLPICVHCGKPLDVISQIQDIDISWEWDDKERRYIKTVGEGSALKPRHEGCETSDWDFIDFNLADF